MNLKHTQLSKLCNSFYHKHKEIISDILLYGSSIRGKEFPNDTDILLIFKNKINKDLEYELKNILKNITPKVSIISKNIKTINHTSFVARASILFEGYSLIKKKYISSDYGFVSKGLFIYQTKNLQNSYKTRFYYAFNGRRLSHGIIQELNCIKLSDNLILVPLINTEKIKEFFNHWNIEYVFIPSMIPTRLDKKHILTMVS